MKTCKDCIYWRFHHRVVDEDEASGRCHLYPTIIPTADYHWCGQLKEKEKHAIRATTGEYTLIRGSDGTTKYYKGDKEISLREYTSQFILG